MRTGGCTIQQTLTAEAASVLKHSLNLARRRGHAQVTPLHVAATLLSSRSSLLRRACIKSHPGFSPNYYQIAPSLHHPLHCRALELCFNVALNRLPTIPGPMFHGQPSLANALIAALKRAQAHQRRGCIEQQHHHQQQQQQPLLTIKVELEQLVISILDDPSVSRVMREAGFSSTAVKNCIEDCSVSNLFYGSSVGVFSSPCSPSSNDHHPRHQSIKDLHQPLVNPNAFWQTHFLHHSPDQNPLLISPHKKLFAAESFGLSLKEDVKLVFDVLLRKKKRNPVIVGDSLSVTEGVVSELMAKIERGEVDHPDLKQTHFIKFQFSPTALKFMRREDVETNISELRKKVVSLTSCGKGAVVYIGDLKWAVGENNNINGAQISSSSSSYCPLDHIVEEVGRLISEFNNNINDSEKNNNNTTIRKTRVWVMGTASYQTYMRCQMRQPPLETQLSLQVVSVPSGGLGLSLHATSSGHELRMSGGSQVVEAKAFGGKGDEDVMSCCSECLSSYEREAKAFKSSLPCWLQSHADNSTQKDELLGLRRKWNRICHNLHQGRINNMINQSGPPLNCNQSLMGKTSSSSALSHALWPNPSSGFSESVSISSTGLKPYQRGSNSVAKFRRQNSSAVEIDLGNDHMKDQVSEPKLESLNESEDKNIKITLDLGCSLFHSASSKEVKQNSVLAKALQENIPWQSEILPSIVETLMDSLSSKKDAWMLIGGNDTAAKRRLACVVSESLFGSVDILVHICSRQGGNETKNWSEIIASSLRKHKKFVVLVEDVDSVDAHLLRILSDRFKENQRFGAKNGDDSQVIFILTKEDARNNTYEEKFHDSVIQMTLRTIDQNLGHKRKAELDFLKETKNPRTKEKENELIIKKDFSRQSSFNSILDLNLKAEESSEEAKAGEISPISSDLTREIQWDTHIISNRFFILIENQFTFKRSPNTEKEMREKLVGKMKESFGEVFGGENRIRFSVEEKVIEELCGGYGYFLDGTFENWLREVFQTGLVTVKRGGKKDTVVIRLGFGGIVDKQHGGGGFMGTCLPNKVQVSNIE